ncbi:MAG: hypothetical protein WCX73_05055 [Candidatus Pacearchaeota archaeon]|jgi:hypothetical protein
MDLQEPKIIKSIIPTICPDCGKQIFLGFQTMIPSAVSITTEKDIKEAKEDALKRIDSIIFKSEIKKQEIIDWLQKEETLIEQGDVDSLIKEILKENV